MSTGTAARFYSERWQQQAHLSPDLARAQLASDLPGGFWKHDFVDHALLFNVHFPPDAFFDELAGRLKDLVGAYPTPQWGMTATLAEAIGQEAGRLAIGNGVSELITALVQRLHLRLAVPTPSFNEYERAALPDRLARFALPAPDFELDIEAYAEHAASHAVDAALVISPNNPTSRAVPKAALRRLAHMLGARGQRLIIDESFIEFTANGRCESMESEVSETPNLVILKSLGKIYGIGGLRLGYLLSADEALVDNVRQQLPIWNINTLADYFIGAMSRYGAAFEASCVKVRADRDAFWRLLSSIEGMQVLRPDANFLFCRLPQDWPDGALIVDRLLAQHRILIRHCGIKTMTDGSRYLRIASRTPEENGRLFAALMAVAGTGA